jgi:hypothetical protein
MCQKFWKFGNLENVPKLKNFKQILKYVPKKVLGVPKIFEKFKMTKNLKILIFLNLKM